VRGLVSGLTPRDSPVAPDGAGVLEREPLPWGSRRQATSCRPLMGAWLPCARGWLRQLACRGREATRGAWAASAGPRLAVCRGSDPSTGTATPISSRFPVTVAAGLSGETQCLSVGPSDAACGFAARTSKLSGPAATGTGSLRNEPILLKREAICFTGFGLRQSITCVTRPIHSGRLGGAGGPSAAATAHHRCRARTGGFARVPHP
jgi:hypothetical protein